LSHHIQSSDDPGKAYRNHFSGTWEKWIKYRNTIATDRRHCAIHSQGQDDHTDRNKTMLEPVSMKEIRKHAILFVVLNQLPFRLADEPYFKNLVQGIGPVRKDLSSMAKAITAEVQGDINSRPAKAYCISLSANGWRGPRIRQYLGFTVRCRADDSCR
jgi:hypothetical protein